MLWGDTPTSQFVWGVVMWSRLPSHGNKRGGGLYKILLPKQGIVPYGTFLHEFFQSFMQVVKL